MSNSVRPPEAPMGAYALRNIMIIENFRRTFPDHAYSIFLREANAILGFDKHIRTTLRPFSEGWVTRRVLRNVWRPSTDVGKPSLLLEEPRKEHGSRRL